MHTYTYITEDITSTRACVCVIDVLRRFQQYFSHFTAVTACCIKRDSARVLSAANTAGPWVLFYCRYLLGIIVMVSSMLYMYQLIINATIH